MFSVNYAPEDGTYDLVIKGTSYERDNGNFECRKIESGSGTRLHTSTVELVVLLPPGAPNLSPANPVLTESRPFNVSCSSTGGSPPPVITWFKNNEPGDFNVVFEASRTRDQPSISTLVVSPSKEDDGSEFKCSVWNRAIAKEQTMEESTRIFVNCKFLLFKVTVRSLTNTEIGGWVELYFTYSMQYVKPLKDFLNQGDFCIQPD